jgi:hypothetical protein
MLLRNRSWDRSSFLRFVLGGLVLATAACASVGPRTIPRDQFDYGAAIANSGKEQLLFNIVRLRYVEAPVFVNVASVINQYALESQVSLGAGTNTSMIGGDTLTIGGASRYSDRPTITYTPVSGQEFAQSLLTPILPEHVFALIQAGWPTEVIFRMTVKSMNGIENEWAGPAHRRTADPRFTEMLRAWSRLRKARALGLRREEKETASKIIVYQTGEGHIDEVGADIAFLRETLGLDPDSTEFSLSYGLVPDEPNEIAVLTSSILLIMNELAWRIDVPPEHIEEGRTGATFATSGSESVPLIEVHFAKERPQDAYTAVRCRDYWFYIDDRDVLSKRTFAMLQTILSLTDTGDAARGPVLTITN